MAADATACTAGSHEPRPDRTNSLRFTLWIDAGLTTCWRALTTAAELTAWFTTSTVLDRQATLTFTEQSGSYTKSVDVDRCSAPYALHVVLHDPGYPDSGISVLLEDAARTDSARTQLVLIHRHVPSTLLEGYRQGWPAYLTRLKEHVEHEQATGGRPP